MQIIKEGNHIYTLNLWVLLFIDISVNANLHSVYCWYGPVASYTRICWPRLFTEEAPAPTGVQPCHPFSLYHTSFMARRCLVISVQCSKPPLNPIKVGSKCAGILSFAF